MKKHDIDDELYVSALSQAKDDEHRRVTSLIVDEFVAHFIAAIDALVSGSVDDAT